VLEVGDKVKKLGRTHKWLLSLASRSSEMHEQLKHDISAIEHEIRVAELRLARLNNHLCVLPNFLTLSPTSSTLVASYFSRTSSTDCCTD
jgi:hypothetical protein